MGAFATVAVAATVGASARPAWCGGMLAEGVA